MQNAIKNKLVHWEIKIFEIVIFPQYSNTLYLNTFMAAPDKPRLLTVKILL